MKKLISIIIIAFLSLSFLASIPVPVLGVNLQFDTDFDSGNGTNFQEVTGNHWTFQLVPDDPNDKSWFYVKIINNDTARSIELKITNLYATDYVSPMWSSDNSTWYYIDESNITRGDPHWAVSWLAMNLSLGANEVKYVAYHIPLHYYDLVNYIDSLSHPDLTKVDIGDSADGRELTVLKIHNGSESGKPKIFFVGDVHAQYESYSARNGMGMVDWLLNNSATNSTQARQDVVWYILLSMNPDGLYHGHSKYGYGDSYVNLCDHWAQHDDYAELKAIWDYINETLGGVTVVINSHSWQDPGNHFDWSNNDWCADEEEGNRTTLKDNVISRLDPSSTGTANGGAPNGAMYPEGLSKYGISFEQEQREEENSGDPLFVPYIEWEGEQIARAIFDTYATEGNGNGNGDNGNSGTFGYTSCGESQTPIENRICGSVFVCPQSGTAQNITAWLTITEASHKVKCAIYLQSDSTLVGSTLEKTVGIGTNQEVTFNFSDPKPSLFNFLYVLVAWAESTTGYAYIKKDPGLPDQEYQDPQPYDGWPNPASFNKYDWEDSIYCSYTYSGENETETTLDHYVEYQNYTSYTEYDPNNRLNVQENRINFSGLRKDDPAYIVVDHTITNNFTHQLDFFGVSGSSDDAPVMIWSLTNETGCVAPHNVDALDVSISRDSGNNFYISIRERYDGSSYWSSSLEIDWNTQYYATIKRLGTDFSLKVYSNKKRTSTVVTANLTLHKIYAYTKLYALKSYNTTGTASITGYVEKLRLFSDESTVTTIVSDVDLWHSTRLPSQHHTWKASGRHWAVVGYNLSGSQYGDTCYTSSTDGITWMYPPTLIPNCTGVPNPWSDEVWDGSHIHVIHSNNSLYGAWYLRGICHSNGSITWGNTYQILPDTVKLGDFHACVDSNGYVWVGFGKWGGTYNSIAYVGRNAVKNGSWINYTGYPVSIWDGDNYELSVIMEPLEDGKVYGIIYPNQEVDYYDGSDRKIRGRLFNGSDWEPLEVIAGYFIDNTYFSRISSTSKGNEIYIVYTNKTTFEVLFLYRNSTGDWNTGNELLVYDSNVTLVASISIDSYANILYFFWGCQYEDYIYYRRWNTQTETWIDMEPVDWIDCASDLPTVANGETTNGVHTINSNKKQYGANIQVLYMTSSQSPFKLHYALLNASQDTVKPTYSNINHSSTEAGQSCVFSCLWEDDEGLGGFIFSFNNTGTWANETFADLTQNPQWANVTKILNSTIGLVVGYRWYANDTNDNWNNTGIQTLTTTSTDSPPTYSNVGSNNTVAGGSCKLYTKWMDDESLSIYKIEHNNTGAFQNLTGSLSSNPDWANETITLNSTVGVVVAWRSYANDSANQWNNTAWQYIIISETDVTPPTYSNVGSNNTVAGGSCKLYSYWNDENGLSVYAIEHNNTGSFQNVTGSFSGTPSWANTTIVLNSTIGVVVAWRTHGNDTNNNWNSTSWQYITTTGDTTTPTYSDISTNSTLAGNSTQFRCKWGDDTDLSGYIFSTNNTGSWVNETWTSFSTNPDWANVTKVLNSTVGLVIGYRWYANDTTDNWNNTGIQTLTTTVYQITDRCYFFFNFRDKDNNNVASKITWILYNGSEPLTYIQGEVTITSGTYILKTSYKTHLINTKSLNTSADGNSTVTVALQMKKHLSTSGGYMAFNNTVSLTINSQISTNLTFTATGSGAFKMVMDVPQNASYIQKDGVNQTGWTYSSYLIVIEVGSLSAWEIIFPSESDSTDQDGEASGYYVLIIQVFEGGLPVIANVTIGAISQRTNVFGTVIFKLSYGTYTVITHYGDQVRETNVLLNQDQTITVNFQRFSVPNVKWTIFLIPFGIVFSFLILINTAFKKKRKQFF